MPQRKTSYLSQLHFDPRLKNTWWGRYITNIRFVILLILLIITIGVFSYFNVPRRLNPEIKIPIVIISTVLPGASPTDIESLVTIPLEDKVNNVKGLDTMTSISRDNVSVITLQYLSNVEGGTALQDVQTALGSTAELPEDAQDPVVTLLDFEDSPIWTFAVTTNKDPASLMRFSRQLRDKVKDLTKVDRVEMSGFDTQEIQVIVDPRKIATYGINPGQLSQIFKAATASYPAGSITTEGLTFSLSIDRDIVDIADVRRLQLSANGRQFQLGDIAAVIERSKVNQQKTYLVGGEESGSVSNEQTSPQPSPKRRGSNGELSPERRGSEPQQAVQFYVFKAKNANIDAAEKEVKKTVEETVSQYGGEFRVTTVLNTAEEIIKQFDDLFSEFGLTILLVFTLLIVFLGFRQATISLLTVPLTLLSALAVINAMGLSLNFLTAFAFLIALGLLIDDTIVTVAAMTRYYLTGKFTPAETAILVWRDFIVPLWSMTITVIWAFVPLLLATGIIGEFIKSIPIVVTATMISSTSIAVFITLPLMVVLLKPVLPRRVKILLTILGILGVLAIVALIIPRSSIYPLAIFIALLMLFVIFQTRGYLGDRLSGIRTNRKFTKFYGRFQNGFINIERLSARYKQVIDKILRSPRLRRNTLIAVVIFALVGYALVPLGIVKNEFFPKTDEDILFVQVDLPAGTNLATANSEMLDFVKRIKRTKEMNYFVADTGASLGENGNRADAPGSFLLTIHLIPDEERGPTSLEIAAQLRETLKGYTKGMVNVIELSGGPPAGADVQISILGDDLAVLNTYATRIQTWLKTQPGVTNVQSSNKPSTSKIVFVPDKTKLAENNLTPDALGLWLRTYASGFTLDTIKENNEDMDITFRMGGSTQSPEGLSSIMVPVQSGVSGGGVPPSSDGASVPLLSLGRLQLDTNPSSIVRENSRRQVSVTAGVTQGASATEKNADVVKFADSLGLPAGYTWKTGGVNEENEKSVQSILQAMILSFLLILVTMVIEFGSFRQTLIAMLIIPLGITGVFYVFGLTGTPLSFPALIGILALFGIVVRHVIIVIEKINDNRKHGLDLHESIVDAAGSRLEPVLLTSLATIAGLMPITLSDPLWRGLGGAIIAGLLFSGVIKLFFVPVMYYEWFKGDEKKKKAK